MTNIVLLAGGKSSRMKAELNIDKSLLPFGGCDTLLDYQLNRLNKIGKVYVSAKGTICENVILDKNIIGTKDVSQLYAPMVGFYSALNVLNEALFIAVDSPFFDKEQIKRLVQVAENNSKADAVVATSNNKIHPTIAFYRASILDDLKEHIQNDKLRLVGFLDCIKTITVDFDLKYTKNINDKAGYEEACLLI